MQTGSTISWGWMNSLHRLPDVVFAVAEIGYCLPFRGEELTHCHDDRYAHDDRQEGIRQQDE
jgi:hypothetical protein